MNTTGLSGSNAMRGPYRKCYEIVAYAYEAAFHCVECAKKRFGSDPEVCEDQEGNCVTPVTLEDVSRDDYCDDCLISLDE